MLRFYRVRWSVILILAFLALKPHFSFSQCSITNLDPSYCVDDAAVSLAGGTNYYGPGVSGSTFTPSSAGVGTHTVYSATGIASSYSVSTSGTYNPDLSAPSTITFPSLPADENSNVIAIGFTFNFFGTDYTDLTINANGYVMFGGAVDSGTSQTLPDATDPDNLIAGAWDDLDITAGGTVTTVLVGTPPLRKFIINFDAVRHSGAPQTVSFQIQLHESTNIIELHSQDIQFDGGAGMTQGIENSNGSSAYGLLARNNANWTASSDYVAFTPSCVDIRTVTIDATPTNTLTVSAPANVCAGTGAPVTIGTSQLGILYQLQQVSDSAPLSLSYAGTGANLIITSDALAVSTDIKVYALNSSTGCDADLINTVTVNPNFNAPVINTQPVNSTICQGINTSFTVDAGVTTVPTYQWQVSTNGGVSYVNVSNGVLYSGVTTATLGLTSTPLANNGYLYRVIVGGTCSPSVTSNGALLTVNANAVISTQPATATICEDGTVQFTVVATGSGLTYQWREGGTDITDGGVYGGATTATLTLSNVPSAFNGRQYDVVISGTCSPTTSAAATLNVNQKPEVTVQPVNSITCQGINTSFTVNAGVTTVPTYQWQVSTNGGASYGNVSNGVLYSGVTTATLGLTATPLANNGYLYRVVVSGTCSPPVTSDGALLTVNANAVISTQPATATICEDGTVQFTVVATGSGLTYQWREGGADITDGGVYSGATTATLTLTNVPIAFNGRQYDVVISGTCSPTTSASATLNVNQKPEVTVQPVNSITCQGINTSFTVNAGVTTVPTYQWQVSTNGGVSYGNVSNGVLYSGVTTATLGLTATPLANNGYLYRVIVSGTCSPSVTSDAALLTVNANAVISTQPATATICEDGTVQFTVVATGSGLTYQWREGGADITDGGVYSGATTATLTLTNVPSAFNGRQYDVVISGTCSPTTSASATLNVNQKPEVTIQPVNSITCQGINTSFTVNAGVTTVPTYQWQVSTNGGVSYGNVSNGVLYSGVTTATLGLTATPLANNGYLYRVIVSGTCSPPVTSDGALLTVDQSPVIVTQPITQTVCEGSNVTFTVGATGAGLTYQWQKGGVDIGGETSPSLTLSSVTAAANAGNYTVVVKGTCNATGVTSSIASLAVNEIPEITVQPVNSITCQGVNTSFTVNAGVTTVPTYQWQVSTNGGVSYGNVSNGVLYSGVTTATLGLTATPLANNGYLYRVIVSGTCSPSVTSNGALLTVNSNAVISTQPATATICEDGTVQFTVVATGSGLTYQWREGGTDITDGGVYSGSTTATLTLSNVPSTFNGRQYDVVISGTCSPSTSAAATLNVNQKPEVTVQPVNSTTCEGINTSFTVNAGVTTVPTYQWQVSTNGGVSYSNLSNGVVYGGVTTAALSLTATPLANNGYLYRVIVSGTCSPSVTSNGALLTVNGNAVISTQPATATICEDGTVQFSVVATGGGLTYQWREGGTNITNGGVYSGATSATLTLSNVPSTFNGRQYDVVISSTCSPTTSASATLNVNQKPEVTVQPVNSIICEGTNTSFTVNAGVTTVPTYQWQVSTNAGVSYSNLTNTGIYSGVTTATLSLTAAPSANNGYLYRVIVSGTCSPSVTSDAALLTVNGNAVISTQPATATICEDGTVQFTVVATGGGLTYQWREGGTNITNGGVYSGAMSATLTLSNVPSTFNGRQYDVVISGTCSPSTSTAATLNVNQKPEVTVQPVSSIICEGTNTSFTVNAGVTTVPTYQWQVSTNGGVSYGNVSNGVLYSGVTTATLGLTATPLANNGYLYRVIVSGTCSPPVTSDGALLTVNGNAVISTQPATATICEDGTVQFTVVATGGGLTYQWREGGTNITNGGVYSGATSATLTLSNVPSTFNGRQYDVVISGTCSPSTSAAATLNVNQKPEVTVQPVNSIICEGANTSFTVNAGVTTVPTYQWQVSTNGGVSYGNVSNGVLYSGVTTATLGLTATPLANNGYLYRVIVSGTCSPSVTSNGALLTVNSNAVISTQPATATICEDGTVQFTVVATGSGLTYQWREGGTDITDGGVYSGSTTATLTLSNVPSTFNGRQYDVVISGTCSPSTSAAATLNVNQKPEVTVQPVNSTTCEGINTSFTVNAGVTTVPTYQWQVSTNGGVSYSNLSNGVVYGGVTTAALSLTATPLANNGYLYRVIVSGTCSPSVTSNGALLTVNGNAVISTQPATATICEDGTVQFSVVATGGGLTYQWREGGTNITNGGVYSGATSATLTLSNVPSTFNGRQYDVVISSTCSPTTSASATLNVNQKPEVTVQPVNSIICEGANTSFTVNAGVTTVPTYQWQVSTNGGVSYGNVSNGVLYSGVTTATLGLTATPLANNGYLYRVIVSGTCSPSVTSNGALLTVNSNAVISTQPATATICEDGTVQFTVVATGSGLTYQWREGGADITDGGVYSGATTATLTLSNVPSTFNGRQYDVVISGTCSPSTSTAATLNVNQKPEVTVQPVSSIICEGTNTSFTVNAGVTTVPTYQWQVSTNAGVSYSNLTNTGIYSGVTTATLSLTATPSANNGYLYRVIVSGTCSPSVTSDAALLTVNVNAVISTQPATATICEDGTVQFSVVATGGGLTYQWREGGTDITNGGVYSGATSATLTLSNVPSTFNGRQYDVVISGTCSPTTSAAATLNVNQKPEVTVQPVNSIICEGANTSFTVNAGVTTVPTYQWQVSTNAGVSYGNLTNTGIYSGVATATLSLTAAPLAINGYLYRVIVSGTCSPSVTSDAALLTVNGNAVISIQPATATICEDGPVQFTVVAAGSGLTYQWREDGADISDGGVYSGATSATLTLSNVPSTFDGRQYDVVISGTCSPTTSTSATLNVNQKPEVTVQPVNSIICEGTNTSFTVDAGVTTVPTYQWQVSTNTGLSYSNLTNTGIYGGVTTATLTLTAAPLGNNGYLYRVIVSGTCSPSVISDAALLTVNGNAVITTQPATATICEDGTVQFSVVAAGGGLTYQWREDGADITNGGVYSGATSATLTLSNVPSTFNGRQYDVVISGTCSPTTSTSATLNVNQKPEVTVQPVNSIICEDTNTSFTVDAGVTTVPTYQWQVSTNAGVSYSNLTNTGIYSGVTTATLILTTTPSANNGYLYRVIVGGTCSPSVISDAALLTVNVSAVISTQPATATICEDGTVQFTIVATGSGITYQWREDGADITNGGVYSGATSATLTLSNVPSIFNGRQYNVVIGGTCSPTISTSATLNVNQKPEVTVQPVNSIICEGTNTSFTVDAGVTTVPTYQWQVSTNAGVNFSNLTNTGIYSGVTTATLTLTAAPSANNGYLYRVIVSGTCSPSVTSDAALLTVNVNAMISTQPATATICEDGTVQFSVVATGGGLTYQWREDGADISDGGVYSGATSATLTLSSVPSTFDGRQYDVVIGGTCSPVTSTSATLNVNQKPEVTVQPVNSIICEGTNTSFTVDAGVTTVPTYQWQVSTNTGVSYSNLTNTGIYSGVTTATLTLTAAPLGNNAYVYRVVVSGTCSPSVISDGALLTVDQSPVIGTQPITQTVCEGSNVTFTVGATGAGLTYQWQKGGVDIGGETSPSLTLSSVTAAGSAGNYSVVVRGTCDPTGVTSSIATLTVNEIPEITVQPVNSIICEGTNTSFTVDAGVTTVPTYQWQVSTNAGVSYSNLTNTGIYSGVTTASLTLTAAPLGNNGYLYRVVVSGTCSPSVISDAALLTVNGNAVISTQPATATICEDGTVQFTIVATGSGITYQWREDGAGITNGGVYSGATSATLTLSNVPIAFDGRQYDVVISGTCNPATSASATLNVNQKPEVTVQPVNSIICEGTNTSFTVDAGVTTVPAYQWQVSTNAGVSYSNLTNTGIYSGVTTTTLSLTAAPLANNGYLYRVIVSGTCSPSVISDAALLTVNGNAVISTQPSTATICEDGTVQFTVVAAGSGLTYQWREGGADITDGGVYSGATSATLTLSNVPSTFDGRQYDVVISGTCSPTTSASATLNVNQKPEVTIQPVNSIICEGTNTSFTVDAGVTTVPTYQWQVSTNAGVSYSNLTNTGIYSGVTTATLSLTAAPLANNGYVYRVVISGTCSPSVISDGALLTVDQSPVIGTQPITQTICEGSNVTFTVGAIGTGLTYQWREDGSDITNGGVYSGATSSTLTLSSVPSTFTGRNYSVLITGTCGVLPSATATLTVNRIPDAFAADASICSGSTTNLTITNPNLVPSTTFTWTIQSITNVSGASAGSGNLIAQTLTSTDGVNGGIVTFLIQPTAAGCNGAAYAVNVAVKPIPDVAASPQMICSGSSTSVAITNPNGVLGTSFNWTVLSSSNVSGAVAGSGSTISQVLTSTDGVTSGTVTYRITPIANGCSGSSIDIVVTVSPKPVITNSSTSLIQEICSGTTLSFLPTASIGGTTFNWTSSVIGVLTGVTASGSGAITDTPVNSTNSNAVIIYNITPVFSGCSGNAVNLVVTVRPVPNATASPQTICSGQSTSVSITNPNSVTGTTFTWTVASANVTGATAGAGNIISQVLTSTDGLTTGTVTYTITPSANGCPGPAYNVLVTVKPVPMITNSPVSLSQQICSSQALSFVPTSTIAGATFAWTSTITGPINPGSVTLNGTGAITDAPNNNGNVSGTVTYRIVPSFNGCDGAFVDLVVTVKPLPSATASNVIICSGGTAVINILPTPKNVAGTTFAWTAAPSANVIGSAAGNGSTISQLLSTTNASIGTVTYTITPTANACDGPTTIITATVNPIATVNAGPDFAVCEPVTIPISGTMGGSATTATWTVVTGAGTLSATTLSGTTASATYTVAPSDIAGSVTFLLSTNDPDAGGPCSIVTDQLVVAVNRQARLTLPADYTVCEPSSITLSGALSGSATSGNWTVVTGNGSVSPTSVTGLNATATYGVPVSDVTSTLRFRLTTNDPDGLGPCLAVFDEIDIHVNESAKVNAGTDSQVCEDEIVTLAGSASGTTTSVLWSGGSGASQFSPINNVNSIYTLTPADIAAGGITLTLTTNDPDGSGPCSIVADQVFIKVDKLPSVFLSGLETIYAENSGNDLLDGFPLGGTFSGPGIITGTNVFDPSNAGFGLITIRYTYTDPATTCSNYVEKTTIVNPVTNVDFYVLEDNRPNANGFPQICANQGDLTLIGVPPVSAGITPTYFRALSPELTTRLTFDGTNWKINTNGLLADTLQLQYIFTNTSPATDTLTKDLIVFSAPLATIDVGNNCVEDVVTFTESSSIPNNLSNGTIVNWNWFFDESSNGSNGPIPEPQYTYIDPGSKNITLEVLTDQGCRNKASKTIIVGNPPVADFSWSSYCKGDATKFKDLSGSQFGGIDNYAWDFGDGQSAVVQNPTHTYSNFDVYDVTLTVSTDAGCSSDTTKQVYILDSRTALRNAGYAVDFESGQETWVAVANGATVDNSWIFGLPTGNRISSANSGSNAWWTGGNGGSYFNNEESFVIGPCLNLSDLKRPMISLKYFVDAQKGFDGAVVQFSTNGGDSWETIGDAEGGGLSWYNSRNLNGEPGGQSNFAWSEEEDTVWRDGRYNLDQIPLALRDTVIFRIAFGSNDDNLPGRILNGFAFDDIYIGEKNRNVLVEHFTNVNSNASNQASAYLEDLYLDQLAEKDSSDFIPIQYHLANPGFDQLNADNPEDPRARALLYNVSQPPTTIMDGIQDDYFNGFTANINREELDRRALEDPTFAIQIDTAVTGSGTNGLVTLSILYTYIDSLRPLTTPVTLHAALLERGANGNVVRKLLLESEGRTVTRSWVNGNSEVADITYAIDVPIVNSDSLFILAFVQDQGQDSRKILQSAIIKSNRKKGITIVGLPDDPIKGELKDLSIYPNPASQYLNISSGIKLSREYTWKMIDQRGITVLSGELNQDFSSGPQRIDVSEIANGIYFMAIQTGNKSVVHRKIAVMNRN